MKEIVVEIPQWDEVVTVVRKPKSSIKFTIGGNGRKLIPQFASINPNSIIPKDLLEKMRPFQIEGTLYGIEKKRCFIADEMGLGKTLEVLAIVESLNLFPVLVVCPASVKYNWENEVVKWLPHRTTAILSGNPHMTIAGMRGDLSIKEEADIIIVNYDVIGKYGAGIAAYGFKCYIFDESHYLKNDKAKRTVYAKKLALKISYIYMLTGTVVLNRPQELISQLKILGYLEKFGGEFRFLREFTVKYGYNFTKPKNLDILNERLRSLCYIRRVKKDVLKELPDKQRVNILVELSNRKEYDMAEKNTVAYLKESAFFDEEFLRSVAYLDGIAKNMAIKAHEAELEVKARRMNELNMIELLKQVCARGKLESIYEWIEDFLETDEKLVIFAHHIEIQKALLNKFPSSARIFGEDDIKIRQRNIDWFQDKPECRLIICSLMAGSFGINLTAASTVSFLELGWNPAIHDQGEDRTHRIGQKNAVVAYYFIGQRTIDEDIIQLIEQKRLVINAILEGKDVSAQLSILPELIKRLRNRNIFYEKSLVINENLESST